MTYTCFTQPSIHNYLVADINNYPGSAAITLAPSSISFIQGRGDITISSAVNRTAVDIAITASLGSIYTSVPIRTPAVMGRNVLLSASGNIGSPDQLLRVSYDTIDGSLTLLAGANNGVHIAHTVSNSDSLPINSLSHLNYVTLVYVSSADFIINQPINLPSTNLTLQAIDGAILSSLGTQDTTITAHSITLRAAGNIGTLLIPNSYRQ